MATETIRIFCSVIKYYVKPHLVLTSLELSIIYCQSSICWAQITSEISIVNDTVSDTRL